MSAGESSLANRVDLDVVRAIVGAMPKDPHPEHCKPHGVAADVILGGYALAMADEIEALRRVAKESARIHTSTRPELRDSALHVALKKAGM